MMDSGFLARSTPAIGAVGSPWGGARRRRRGMRHTPGIPDLPGLRTGSDGVSTGPDAEDGVLVRPGFRRSRRGAAGAPDEPLEDRPVPYPDRVDEPGSMAGESTCRARGPARRYLSPRRVPPRGRRMSWNQRRVPRRRGADARIGRISESILSHGRECPMGIRLARQPGCSPSSADFEQKWKTVAVFGGTLVLRRARCVVSTPDLVKRQGQPGCKPTSSMSTDDARSSFARVISDGFGPHRPGAGITPVPADTIEVCAGWPMSSRVSGEGPIVRMKSAGCGRLVPRGTLHDRRWPDRRVPLQARGAILDLARLADSPRMM
jgi:hypothetical protein